MALTLERIEKKEYTFVSVVIRDGVTDDIAFESFLVPSPYKAIALEQAKLYVSQRRLWLKSWDQMGSQCKCCGCFSLYPRNYIRKARKLFAERKYLDT